MARKTLSEILQIRMTKADLAALDEAITLRLAREPGAHACTRSELLRIAIHHYLRCAEARA